jgi:hypothetical protein
MGGDISHSQPSALKLFWDINCFGINSSLELPFFVNGNLCFGINSSLELPLFVNGDRYFRIVINNPWIPSLVNGNQKFPMVD